MVIFFDLGRKGAISFFQEKKLIKVLSYQLSKKTKGNISLKIKEFYQLLREKFIDKERVEKVGLFLPFGKNRKIIINLAMLNAIVIFFFSQQKIILLNEWKVFLTVLALKKIPPRKLKKQLTVAWSEKKFNIRIENHDQADAILGGYYLIKEEEN